MLGRTGGQEARGAGRADTRRGLLYGQRVGSVGASLCRVTRSTLGEDGVSPEASQSSRGHPGQDPAQRDLCPRPSCA